MRSVVALCGCVFALLLQGMAPAGAQGQARPEAKAGAAAPPAAAAAKGPWEERCRENPKQCEEMKAKLAQRREQCKADPQKCREEMQANFEERCKANPKQCEEFKEKMQQ